VSPEASDDDDSAFTCAACGRTFERGRDDDDARAEAIALWGQRHDMAIVCEDCFLDILGLLT
jgi:hypothetical protein